MIIKKLQNLASVWVIIALNYKINAINITSALENNGGISALENNGIRKQL